MDRQYFVPIGVIAAGVLSLAVISSCTRGESMAYTQTQVQPAPVVQQQAPAPVVVQQADNGPGWGGALAAGALGYMAGKNSAQQQVVQPSRQVIVRERTIIRERAAAPAPAPEVKNPTYAPAAVPQQVVKPSVTPATSPSTFKAPTPTTNVGSFSARPSYSGTTTSFSRPSVSVGGRR
jgi:predicted lipid-binding transport protein (Tim44 family)